MKDEIKEKFKEKHKKEIEEINNQFEELIKDDEIKEISQNSDFFHHFLHIFPEKTQLKNDLLDYITTLQKENDQLKNLEYKFFDNSGDEESFTLEDYLELGNNVYDLQEENKKLKARIDKAINIIQNDTTLNPQRQRERLINILQGDDNNE